MADSGTSIAALPGLSDPFGAFAETSSDPRWGRLAMSARRRERRLALAPPPGPPEPNAADEEAESRALARRARAGDDEAAAALFSLHRHRIERLCRRLLRDDHSAEDAASDVFLKARRAFPTYDLARPFGPWLRTIASNHCLDVLRRRKTERSIFSADDPSDRDFADRTPSAAARIAQREDQRAVLEALETLPEKYRLPLVLRFYQELDYDGIGEVLGVSRNQVATLLFRAKKQLRAAILAQNETAPGERHE